MKKLLKVLAYLILIPFLIYNLTIITEKFLFSKKNPSFFGIRTYIIISGSMEPNINIGDIIVVKSTEQKALTKGDIISFRENQSIITHRINEVLKLDGEIKYRTKGDKNNICDSELVKYENIEGKVILILPKVGKLILFLQKRKVIILLFIGFYIYMLLRKKYKGGR